MRILVDTSVWIALSISQHDSHELARSWFISVPNRDRLVICRSTQQSFLRIMTVPAVWSRFGRAPLTNDEAWATYDRLSSHALVTFSEEPPMLDERWKRFATRPTSSPHVWMDAYLAAFALADGMQLVTLDSGFRQFDQLDVTVLTSS